MVNNQKAEYSVLQLDSITFSEDNNSGSIDTIDPSLTGDAISVSNNTATLVGYATSILDNLSTDLRVGFIYCLDGTPSKTNGTQVDVEIEDVASDGRYIKTINNLLAGATYYFRSFVYQSGLWFYGKVKSFITNAIDINFTTGEVTDITCFSAKASGSINIQSPYTTLICGICYGTGIEPTIADKTVTATSVNFTLNLCQLYGGTTYYYRSYAIIDGQTYYGTVRTFRTLDDNVVETGTIDEETLTVTSHLTISGGPYSSLVLGVCYGTIENPTISNNCVTSDEVDDENNYTVQLFKQTGWGTFTTIYYRAYILIDGTPHYGPIKFFERLDPDFINQIDNVRYGAYRTFTQTMSKLAVWGDLRSDSYSINSINNSAQTQRDMYINIMNGHLDSTMSVFDWSSVYTTINYCNNVLRYSNQILSGESGHQIIAEFTALRALNYFYLIRAFKDVPYITKARNATYEDEKYPLTNQLEVLDSIIADCESVKGQARERFSDKRDSRGAITNSTIYAMLADMYLWRGSLHEGRHSKTGSDIINGETIYHNVNDDYNKVIEYVDLCLESVKNRNQYEKENGWPYYKETINYGINNCDMIKNDFDGAAQSTTPALEAQTAIFNEKNSIESIFEIQYSLSDELPNTFVNSLYGFGAGTHLMVNDEAFNELYSGGILGDGDNGGMWDSRLWVCCQNKLTSDSQSNVEPQSGYYCLKYQLPNSNFLNMEGLNRRREIKSIRYASWDYNNWIIYRMTDVMLMKAEALACISNNNLSQVKAICNAIHRRSYCNYRNPYKVPNTDANVGTVGNAYGTQKTANNGVIIPEGVVCVMNERQIELIAEGKRWFDLVRLAERCSYNESDPADPRETGVTDGKTGMSAIVDLFICAGSRSNSANTLTNRLKNRYGLYSPIYYLEVKASDGVIEQNPVWNESWNEQ